jgi:hypothetical protein
MATCTVHVVLCRYEKYEYSDEENYVVAVCPSHAIALTITWRPFNEFRMEEFDGLEYAQFDCPLEELLDDLAKLKQAFETQQKLEITRYWSPERKSVDDTARVFESYGAYEEEDAESKG